MTVTYREGLERSIANADRATTPHSIEDGYHILRHRLDEHSAQDFAHTARRIQQREDLTAADSVAAIWWAYA